MSRSSYAANASTRPLAATLMLAEGLSERSTTGAVVAQLTLTLSNSELAREAI